MISDMPLTEPRWRPDVKTRKGRPNERRAILTGLLAAVAVAIVVIAAVTYGLTSHPAASVLRSPVAAVLLSPAASVLRVAGHSECGSGVGDGSGLRQGSGFVAAPGIVITDAHVIYGDHDPMVQAGGRYYPATVVVFDPAADLAVLRTSGPLPPPLTLVTASIGTKGTLVGYPVRSPRFTGPAVITGTTANTSTGITRTLLVVHADGRQGDSGGPFITHDGRVAGIFELYWPGEWTNDFIPVAAITRVLEQAADQTAPVSTSTCGPIGPPR
jgi:S1-C subfamily serine protease